MSDPPGLAEAFRAWTEPDPDPGPFLADGLVAIDANALLHLYRVTPASRAQILSTLELIQDQLWIPHQAALEFHRNRTAAVAGRLQRYDTTRRALSDATGKAVQDLRRAVGQLVELRAYNMIEREWDPAQHELHNAGLHRMLAGLLTPALAELATMRAEHDVGMSDVIAGDPILERLDVLTRGRVGRPYDQSSLIDIVRVATEFRYPNEMPPGYLDAGKSAPYLAAGDYIVWRQVLDRVAEIPGKRRVVLITNDTKPDWWVLDKNGSPIRTRPELRQEMAEYAHAEMILLTLSGFLDAATRQFPGTVTDETVEAVRASEEQKRSEDLAARLGVAAVPLLIVDGANVVGSVADGWWKDRVGAAVRLRDRLAGLTGTGVPEVAGPVEVVLVVEGTARDIPAVDGVRLVRAAAAGDDAIVQVVAEAEPGRTVVVVTADRALRERVVALGALVIGPSSIPR